MTKVESSQQLGAAMKSLASLPQCIPLGLRAWALLSEHHEGTLRLMTVSETANSPTTPSQCFRVTMKEGGHKASALLPLQRLNPIRVPLQCYHATTKEALSQAPDAASPSATGLRLVAHCLTGSSIFEKLFSPLCFFLYFSPSP